MPYNIGDVVLVSFHWREEDGTVKTKPRPAIVAKIHQEKSHALIKVTHVNRSSKISGYWITKDSDIGKEMGLLMDSFINLVDTYWVENKYILRKIGVYRDIDKALEARKNLKLGIKKQVDPD